VDEIALRLMCYLAEQKIAYDHLQSYFGRVVQMVAEAGRIVLYDWVLMGCLESWASRYIVRYTSDTLYDSHLTIFCECDSSSPRVAVDIDSQDIGAGDVFSLPS